MLMVEFESDALWYETSLTMAAQAVREGKKTPYHVFEHPPDDVRRFLGRIGLDVGQLENDGVFHLDDSFTVQTGLGLPSDKPGWEGEPVAHSLKVSDWSLAGGQRLKAGIPEEHKNWLHIDENLGVLLQYNQEKAVIDWARTRAIPLSRADLGIGLHSFVKGVASDSFYKQFESLCDGIIDFKNEEKGTEIEHLLRVRSLRGKKHDTRWHRLQLQENGEVTLID